MESAELISPLGSDDGAHIVEGDVVPFVAHPSNGHERLGDGSDLEDGLESTAILTILKVQLLLT